MFRITRWICLLGIEITGLCVSTFSANYTSAQIIPHSTLHIDYTHRLTNLTVVDVDTIIPLSCSTPRRQSQSQFIITGRGGLPLSPYEVLDADSILVDFVTLDREQNTRQPGQNRDVREYPVLPSKETHLQTYGMKIVEATGWVMDRNGNIILTTSKPSAIPHSSLQKTFDCGLFNRQPKSR